MDEHPPTSLAPPQPGANRVGADYSGSTGEQTLVNALLAQRTGALGRPLRLARVADVRTAGPRSVGGCRLMSRNSKTISAGIKLGIFTVVSILVTGLLAAIMGNIGFGAGTTYQAVFTTASMLKKGDDVRIAGVSVGEVKDVEHYHRSEALVTFRVKADVPLTTASHAEIRFLNLVGDRYLALEEGSDSGREAAAGRRHDPGRARPSRRST